MRPAPREPRRGRAFRWRLALETAVVLVLAAGCAGSPTPASGQSPPDWVIQRPADDATYFYFTGSGTSAGGDLNEARAAATGEVLAEIMRYVGVTVSSDTTATARGSLDDYRASIEQVVRQTGKARVSGLDIRDTWTDRRAKPAVSVHVLARYQRGELLAEKQRLEALFQERVEAVEGPEREGDRLAAAGRPYEAAIQYMSAAAAALGPDIDNAAIKLKRNLDKARASIERISLVKLNDNLRGRAGEPLPEPLRLKVVAGASASDPGVPDAGLLVTYQESNEATGRPRFKNERIKSDSTGVAAFAHPIPELVGDGTVIVALDLASYVEPLLAAPRAMRDQVESLESLITTRRTTFRFSVESSAGSVPMAILLLDFDAAGHLVGTTDSTGSAQSALAGYEIRTLAFSSEDVSGKSDEDLLALVKDRYGARIDRLVLGRVRITEVSQRSGRVFARAGVEAKVYDLAGGSVLVSINREKLSMGASDEEARSRVFRDIGLDLGAEVKRRLK